MVRDQQWDYVRETREKTSLADVSWSSVTQGQTLIVSRD